MKKTISVIVATYNSEKSIERLLNSILNQSGIGNDFDIELIVVDDCSTDKTTEIVRKYNANLLSTNKNSGGPNTGRNIGLKKASGDYICIADHDDEWKENKILLQLPYLETVPIVTCGYTIHDIERSKNIDKVNTSIEGFQYFGRNETFLQKLTKSLTGQITYLGGIIYKKELKDILFEENFGMVDYDWLLRLLHLKDSIEVCESLYDRHVSKVNLSLNENYRIKDFYFSLMFIEQYLPLYPKEVKISYKKIHGSRARYYYLINNMKLARFYFLRSHIDLKTIAYYITSFWGSKYVIKKYNVFG
ncbi:glycosyltransferase family 2 protein [Cryomorpha ignava]|uniref:Glycosyltransferase family 2 protein n=1 Tax=Cryomorpha ignava TaxID=101383 RepID=A0A7K3WM48_9FLAO|nr:glycosyltransferase family 2 protein [Cryomorpha ignava]NEN22720.1 glycosyltransferase family 2 protein [Cryomorpha ignava]